MPEQKAEPDPPEALQNLSVEAYTARIIKQKVWRRANVKNKHFMGVVVGREGHGKSHTALKIASGVDPSFNAERVFFKPERLLETVQSNELGTGHAVVIDEAGVGLGSRTWYDKDQIMLNQALQTIRDDNMIVLFTLPRLSELDSQTRGRLHAYIEMQDVYPGDGYATARWLNISPSRDGSGQIYKKYVRLRAYGRKKRIEQVRFRPPDRSLVESYEERKEAFKEELFEEILEDAEAESKSEEADPEAIAQEIADESVADYISEDGKTGRPYINKDLIRAGYEISHSDARAVKSMLEQVYSDDQLGDLK